MRANPTVEAVLMGEYDKTALVEACRECKADDGVAIAVLAILAGMTRKDGRVWPSVAFLAERTTFTSGRIATALRALDVAGLAVAEGYRNRCRVRHILPHLCDSSGEYVSDSSERYLPDVSQKSRELALDDRPDDIPDDLSDESRTKEKDKGKPQGGGALRDHENSENVRRAIANLNLGRFADAIEELCYLADPDPWEGYRKVKWHLDRVDLRDPSMRDPVAVLRWRLGLRVQAC